MNYSFNHKRWKLILDNEVKVAALDISFNVKHQLGNGGKGGKGGSKLKK